MSPKVNLEALATTALNCSVVSASKRNHRSPFDPY
jgi:hypothetical protein